MAFKVLFWNINKRDDSFIDELKDVAKDYDLMLLAESKITDNVIEAQIGLKRVNPTTRRDHGDLTPKLYSNIDKKYLQHIFTNPSRRLIFFSLQTQEYGEVIIGGLHFPSKVTYKDSTQSDQAILYSNDVKEVEKLRKHKRTILFGDFNMNPFEEGMVKPLGFNATLSYDIAVEGSRTFHHSRNKYDYFYNPMWNWLGDRDHNSGKSKIPGTIYFRTTSDISQIYWNVFDKVIVRPDVIDIIDYSSLEIKSAIPIKDLVSRNSNKKKVELVDHLPISFKLNITL